MNQPSKIINVLLIEDDPGDADLLRKILSEENKLAFHVEHVDKLQTGLECLAKGGTDVVLLDLALPDSQGIETFVKVHAQTPSIPIVVLTGFDDDTVALEAVRKGAQDYLVKGQVDGKMLARVIRYAIERKRVEREIRLAEEKYRTIFDNSAVAITVTDEKERIVSWNKFAEDLLGMNRDDFYLRPVSSLYPEEEWKKIRSENIRQKGLQHHLETKAIKKNGQLIDINVSISVLKNESGNVTGAIGIIRDITERKQAERKIKEAFDIKSEFISMVSHELRTPLAVIKEGVAVVLDGSAGEINATQKDFLHMAKQNVDRLARLINDVLDFQKLESGAMEYYHAAHDINQLIRELEKATRSLVKKDELNRNHSE